MEMMRESVFSAHKADANSATNCEAVGFLRSGASDKACRPSGWFLHMSDTAARRFFSSDCQLPPHCFAASGYSHFVTISSDSGSWSATETAARAA